MGSASPVLVLNSFFLSSVSLEAMEPNPLRLLSVSVLVCLAVSLLKVSIKMQRIAILDCLQFIKILDRDKREDEEVVFHH